jgi:nicotinamidase-related amidase
MITRTRFLRRVRFLYLTLMAAIALFPTSGLSGHAPDSPPGLVIIDIQNFYFAGGSLPLQGSAEAALQAKRILELFRAKNWPVFPVRHLPQGMADAPWSGDPQWSFRADVKPLAGEPVITKHEVNGFRGTDLLALLNGRKLKNLVIVGMQTHMCLEGAVRAAADYGFAVTVAEDACATRDLEFSGHKITAEQVHFSTLATLNKTYAKVVTTDELLKELGREDPPAGVK